MPTGTRETAAARSAAAHASPPTESPGAEAAAPTATRDVFAMTAAMFPSQPPPSLDEAAHPPSTAASVSAMSQQLERKALMQSHGVLPEDGIPVLTDVSGDPTDGEDDKCERSTVGSTTAADATAAPSAAAGAPRPSPSRKAAAAAAVAHAQDRAGARGANGATAETTRAAGRRGHGTPAPRGPTDVWKSTSPPPAAAAADGAANGAGRRAHKEAASPTPPVADSREPAEPHQHRTGEKDIVLDGVPMLRSPSWSSEDEMDNAEFNRNFRLRRYAQLREDNKRKTVAAKRQKDGRAGGPGHTPSTAPRESAPVEEHMTALPHHKATPPKETPRTAVRAPAAEKRRGGETPASTLPPSKTASDGYAEPENISQRAARPAKAAAEARPAAAPDNLSLGSVSSDLYGGTGARRSARRTDGDDASTGSLSHKAPPHPPRGSTVTSTSGMHRVQSSLSQSRSLQRRTGEAGATPSVFNNTVRPNSNLIRHYSGYDPMILRFGEDSFETEAPAAAAAAAKANAAAAAAAAGARKDASTSDIGSREKGISTPGSRTYENPLLHRKRKAPAFPSTPPRSPPVEAVRPKAEPDGALPLWPRTAMPSPPSDFIAGEQKAQRHPVYSAVEFREGKRKKLNTNNGAGATATATASKPLQPTNSVLSAQTPVGKPTNARARTQLPQFTTSTTDSRHPPPAHPRAAPPSENMSALRSPQRVSVSGDTSVTVYAPESSLRNPVHAVSAQAAGGGAPQGRPQAAPAPVPMQQPPVGTDGLFAFGWDVLAPLDSPGGASALLVSGDQTRESRPRRLHSGLAARHRSRSNSSGDSVVLVEDLGASRAEVNHSPARPSTGRRDSSIARSTSNVSAAASVGAVTPSTNATRDPSAAAPRSRSASRGSRAFTDTDALGWTSVVALSDALGEDTYSSRQVKPARRSQTHTASSTHGAALSSLTSPPPLDSIVNRSRSSTEVRAVSPPANPFVGDNAAAVEAAEMAGATIPRHYFSFHSVYLEGVVEREVSPTASENGGKDVDADLLVSSHADRALVVPAQATAPRSAEDAVESAGDTVPRQRRFAGHALSHSGVEYSIFGSVLGQLRVPGREQNSNQERCENVRLSVAEHALTTPEAKREPAYDAYEDREEPYTLLTGGTDPREDTLTAPALRPRERKTSMARRTRRPDSALEWFNSGVLIPPPPSTADTPQPPAVASTGAPRAQEHNKDSNASTIVVGKATRVSTREGGAGGIGDNTLWSSWLQTNIQGIADGRDAARQAPVSPAAHSVSPAAHSVSTVASLITTIAPSDGAATHSTVAHPSKPPAKSAERFSTRSEEGVSLVRATPKSLKSPPPSVGPMPAPISTSSQPPTPPPVAVTDGKAKEPTASRPPALPTRPSQREFFVNSRRFNLAEYSRGAVEAAQSSQNGSPRVNSPQSTSWAKSAWALPTIDSPTMRMQAMPATSATATKHPLQQRTLRQLPAKARLADASGAASDSSRAMARQQRTAPLPLDSDLLQKSQSPAVSPAGGSADVRASQSAPSSTRRSGTADALGDAEDLPSSAPSTRRRDSAAAVNVAPLSAEETQPPSRTRSGGRWPYSMRDIGSGSGSKRSTSPSSPAGKQTASAGPASPTGLDTAPPAQGRPSKCTSAAKAEGVWSIDGVKVTAP